jgi:hypothetical protein
VLEQEVEGLDHVVLVVGDQHARGSGGGGGEGHRGG